MSNQSEITEQVYRTITGERTLLSGLSDAEYAFLDMIAKKYNARQDWTRFAAWWNAKFNASGLGTDSVVYRICQDLEARLGINQGKVSPPDYRDYLADLIDARFASRQDFCRATKVDPGQLSRVLASRDNLSMKVLMQVLEVLDVQLVIQTKQDSHTQSSVDWAENDLKAILARRNPIVELHPKSARQCLKPARDLLLNLFHGSKQELTMYLLKHTWFISPKRIQQYYEQEGRFHYFEDYVRTSRKYHRGMQKNDPSVWNDQAVKVCDNTKAREAFSKFTDIALKGNKPDRVRGYHVAHIWENVHDPEYFTAGWNLCLIPGFLKLFTEKQDPIVLFQDFSLQDVIKQAAFNLYFKSGRLTGLAPPAFVTDPGLKIPGVSLEPQSLKLLGGPEEQGDLLEHKL
jgi:hypothetical protein